MKLAAMVIDEIKLESAKGTSAERHELQTYIGFGWDYLEDRTTHGYGGVYLDGDRTREFKIGQVFELVGPKKAGK